MIKFGEKDGRFTGFEQYEKYSSDYFRMFVERADVKLPEVPKMLAGMKPRRGNQLPPHKPEKSLFSPYQRCPKLAKTYFVAPKLRLPKPKS